MPEPQTSVPDITKMLSGLPVDPATKRQAWVAFYGTTDKADFRQQFDAIPSIPDSFKADLWDLRFSGQIPSNEPPSAPATAAPTPSPIASQDITQPPTPPSVGSKTPGPGLLERAREGLFQNVVKSAGGASVSDAYDMATNSAAQLVSKVTSIPVERLKKDFPGVRFVAELARAAPEALDFLMSPSGVAASAGSRVPGVAPAVGAAFTVDVGRQLPEAWEAVKQDPSAENVARLIKTGVFSALPGWHAYGPKGAKAKPVEEPPRPVEQATPIAAPVEPPTPPTSPYYLPNLARSARQAELEQTFSDTPADLKGQLKREEATSRLKQFKGKPYKSPWMATEPVQEMGQPKAPPEGVRGLAEAPKAPEVKPTAVEPTTVEAPKPATAPPGEQSSQPVVSLEAPVSAVVETPKEGPKNEQAKAETQANIPTTTSAPAPTSVSPAPTAVPKKEIERQRPGPVVAQSPQKSVEKPPQSPQEPPSPPSVGFKTLTVQKSDPDGTFLKGEKYIYLGKDGKKHSFRDSETGSLVNAELSDKEFQSIFGSPSEAKAEPIKAIDQPPTPPGTKPQPKPEAALERATKVRDYWQSKTGSYQQTERGIEQGGATGKAVGGTFKEINERRAQTRVQEMEAMIKTARERPLTQSEIEKIEGYYSKLPKEIAPKEPKQKGQPKTSVKIHSVEIGRKKTVRTDPKTFGEHVSNPDASRVFFEMGQDSGSAEFLGKSGRVKIELDDTPGTMVIEVSDRAKLPAMIQEAIGKLKARKQSAGDEPPKPPGA